MDGEIQKSRTNSKIDILKEKRSGTYAKQNQMYQIPESDLIMPLNIHAGGVPQDLISSKLREKCCTVANSFAIHRAVIKTGCGFCVSRGDEKPYRWRKRSGLQVRKVLRGWRWVFEVGAMWIFAMESVLNKKSAMFDMETSSKVQYNKKIKSCI